MANPTSVVYFVQIGKRVKIGTTKNLIRRLKEFATSTPDVLEVLATLPGGRKEEKRIHSSLIETRHWRGEFFQMDYRLMRFVDLVAAGKVQRAWEWLDESHPAVRDKRKAEEHSRRVAESRASRAQLNAYFASLVNDRKQRLGR